MLALVINSANKSTFKFGLLQTVTFFSSVIYIKKRTTMRPGIGCDMVFALLLDAKDQMLKLKNTLQYGALTNEDDNQIDFSESLAHLDNAVQCTEQAAEMVYPDACKMLAGGAEAFLRC